MTEIKKELENWRHQHFHGRRDKDANGEYLKRTKWGANNLT